MRGFRRIFFGAGGLVLLGWLADPAKVLSAEADRQSLTSTDSPYGRVIDAVRVEAAWARSIPLSLRPGVVLTRENLSIALNELREALSRQLSDDDLIPAYAGFHYIYVDAIFENPSRPESRKVTVILRPFVIGLRFNRFHERALPIPRAPWLAFPPPLPDEIRRFAPTLSFSSDKSYGSAIAADLDFNSKLNSRTTSPEFSFQGGLQKSLDAEFHDFAGRLAIRAHPEDSGIDRVRGSLGAGSLTEPFGGSTRSRRQFQVEGGLVLKPWSNSRLWADLNYGEVRERLGATAAFAPWSQTHRGTARVMLEAIPARAFGLVRAALWAEYLDNDTSGTSNRFAAAVGYAKDFAVSPNQSIGVEVTGAYGHSNRTAGNGWDFIAGNTSTEFLFAAADSSALLELPRGPRVRSLGQAQGGFLLPSGLRVGGDEFWQMNLTVSLPVPRWSRPLIPNEDIDMGTEEPFTLKQLLETLIQRTGPSMLEGTLRQTEGLSDEQARAKAAAVFEEIRPATTFIIDQANVFAVKPLVMFDAAELRSPLGSERWTAAGAGIQLIVVTAKFDIGHMRTLSGPTFGSRGNTFARLVFTRLF